MPAACALAMPSASCDAMSSTRTRSGASCSRARRVRPWTCSITMYGGTPGAVPISWMVMMLGWFSDEAVPRLLPEARQALGTVGEGLRQELDRDVAIQVAIARAVHLAHPPMPSSSRIS